MVESLFFSIFLFLLGSAVGSFLYVVVLRVPKKNTIRGRSRCPHCKHTLAWYDLIPVVSFLVLYGRCRYCGKMISWQYPLVELTVGMLFVAGFLVFGPSADGLSLFFFALYASFLVAIFVLDYTKYIIPDFLSVPAMLIALLGSLTMGLINHPFSLETLSGIASNLGVAILIGGGFFLAQFWISQGRWVGGGDIRLGVVMGLMLGFPVIVAALGLAYVVGAVWSLLLMAFKRKTMKDALPFGTFLTASTVVCLLWGNELVNAYMRFIGF